MEPIDIFKKIRDASDEVVKALESNDEEKTFPNFLYHDQWARQTRRARR